LALRIATDDEVARIARIAALDSARPPEAPVLIAEVDGEIRVAVSLADMRSVADPFHFTEQIRAIAMSRARQLQVPNGRARPRRTVLRTRRWPAATA
jgi:hypothetical protein